MIRTINNNINDVIETIKITIHNVLADKMLLLLFTIILIIFIGLAYYTYTKFIKPNININKNLTSNDKNDDVMIILFKTEWCPHCKSAMPEWNKFKNYVKNINNTNTFQVKLNIVDCDAEPKLAEKYDIDGYPTVKLIYKGITYDYDAKIDKENLVKFLESSIA